MLLVKTEAAGHKAESAEDITAAAMAPIPKIETYNGVRCCKVMGRMRAVCPCSNGDGEP